MQRAQHKSAAVCYTQQIAGAAHIPALHGLTPMPKLKQKCGRAHSGDAPLSGKALDQCGLPAAKRPDDGHGVATPQSVCVCRELKQQHDAQPADLHPQSCRRAQHVPCQEQHLSRLGTAGQYSTQRVRASHRRGSPRTKACVSHGVDADCSCANVVNAQLLWGFRWFQLMSVLATACRLKPSADIGQPWAMHWAGARGELPE